MAPQFAFDKHVKYYKRVLGLLPAQYQSEDSNRLAIIYFSLNALSLMGQVDAVVSPQERATIIDSIYDDYLVPSGEGFRGSPVYNLGTKGSTRYDPPNLAATFFALNALFILRDDKITERLDRHKIMSFVARCQLSSGELKPFVDKDGNPYGDTDLRYAMIGATIRLFLQVDQWRDLDLDLNIDALANTVIGNLCYDGGLGGGPHRESHAGLTFCGISTLRLIGKSDAVNWDKTIRFLVNRQVPEFSEKELEYDFNDEDDFGGFNGRLNKFGDTCYCFWCLGSLSLITDRNLIDKTKVIEFLQRTENKLMGGFNKSTDPDDKPDPMHSFLGLVTLSLLNQDDQISSNLKKINVLYMLDEDTVEFMSSLKWH